MQVKTGLCFCLELHRNEACESLFVSVWVEDFVMAADSITEVKMHFLSLGFQNEGDSPLVFGVFLIRLWVNTTSYRKIKASEFNPITV